MTTLKKAIAVLVIASLTGLLTACGAGSGEGLDANGRPLSENPPDTGEGSSGQPSSDAFTKIQAEILTPDCATSTCHSGSSSPLGLNLAEGKSYEKLVNIPSNQVDGLLLVEPSNADASYLIHKIEGTGGGELMPLRRPALSKEQIELVRDWIKAGALPPSNEGSETAGAFKSTLSDIQKYVFDIECKDCHSGENPAGDLNLEKSRSYAQLVGRPLQFDPDNSILVVAGDAESSLLINKLNGIGLGDIDDENFKGRRMPLGGPFLEDSTIQIIKDWINNGAEDN